MTRNMMRNRVVILAAFTLVVSALVSSSEDWEKRWNERQPPDKVMDAVGIEPGMTVAEFGAGRGRYAVQVAARLGARGKMYAEDIDAGALEYLASRCERDNIQNVETILGTVTDPKFPKGSCDFAYCINTYHHIEQPVQLLRNMIPGLKPDGRLVIIEHSPEKALKEGFEGHCTPTDSVVAHATAAGYKLVETHSFLELDEIYVFAVAAKEKAAD